MRKLLAVLLAVVAVVGVSACSEGRTNNVVEHAAANVNHRLALLERAEPLAEPRDSADRRTQNYFYTAEADPNKIWYLETLSYTGNVEASYTIRGPVVSASDELTNPQQIECSGHENDSCVTLGLAEPNGVYQHPGNDHLAVLADGALLRFEGNYQTSDQPFTIKTPETLSVNASAPITNTNTSLTQGGIRPPGH